VPGTPTPSPEFLSSYELQLVRDQGGSLWLVNQGRSAFPLENLCLGDCAEGGRTPLEGQVWKEALLKEGACVVAWKKGAEVKEPPLDCDQVGKDVTWDEKDIFWQLPFGVYYEGMQMGVCQLGLCTLQLASGGIEVHSQRSGWTLYLPLLFRN